MIQNRFPVQSRLLPILGAGFRQAVRISSILMLGPLLAVAQDFPPAQLRRLAFEATANLNLDLSNQMQFKENVVAYATADSIHLLNAPVACPASLCSECILFTTRLLSIAIPGGRLIAPPALALVSGDPNGRNGNPPTRATFAVLPPRGKLHLYTAKSGSETGVWTLTHDSVALDMKSDQQARLLDFQVVSRASDPLGGAAFLDSSFTVAGSQGLLSYVGWKNGGLGEVINGTFAGDDITAIGPGMLGGASGWIYRLARDTGPVRMTHPFTGAIRSLDETGALGDSGWVAVKETSGWSGYKITGSGYRGFQIGYEAAGLAIDLWGRTGTRVHQVLRDAPTIYAVVSDKGDLPREPDGGTNTYLPSMDQWTITLRLTDPEGNFRVPDIELSNAPSNAEQLTGGLMQRTVPLGGCEAPGICIQANAPEIKLLFKRDSIVMSMKVQASINLMCGSTWAEKKDSLIRISRAWKPGDALHIGEKGSGYSFIYNPGTALGAPVRQAAPRFPSVLERGRGLAAWPEGLRPHPSARAVMYGADGMRMGEFSPGERLLRFNPGLAYVVWPDSKGNTSVSRILLR